MSIKKLETLNAYGPYDHSIWMHGKNNNINLFQKRSEYLVKIISKILLENFSKKKLKDMTIIDIGCYDGYVLYNLAKKFNFKKVVGVEPRLKNIQKGVIARKFYKKNNCKIDFIQGNISNFNNKVHKKFDIVLCLGTLHHVSSVINSIKNICKASKNLVILDSMIIDRPEKKFEKNILNLLNLKDIAYMNKQDWAISAFKYETPYFDGSTSHEPIVSVPEERLIKMSLESVGAKVLKILKPHEHSYKKEFQKLRGVKETLIVSRVNPKENWIDQAKSYEKQFCLELLPKDIIPALFDYNDKLSKYFVSKYDNKKINQIRTAIKDPTINTNMIFLKKIIRNKSQRVIVQNIFRAKNDKKNIEIGKWLLILNEFKLAKLYFLKVTRSKESDWRSFYRACYFLSIIGTLTKEKNLNKYYLKLLKISQPYFPLSINQGVSWLKNLN